MLRVLMVIEDYGELMYLQTISKKIGFDVFAIQNPRTFEESLLTMNPDVLVMTAHGKKIHGFDMAKTVKRVRGLPHAILLRQATQIAEDDPAVQAWLESPVNPVQLLDVIADLCGLNKQSIQEKFQRLRQQGIVPESDGARILKSADGDEAVMERSDKSSGNFGQLEPSRMSDVERRERFKKFLDDKPRAHAFSVKTVQEQMKALRKEESKADLTDLEAERKAFVEHLFKRRA